MRRIMCCKTSKNYVINTQGSLCTEREMQMAGNVPRVEREREMQARGFGERRFGICLYLSCNGSGKPRVSASSPSDTVDGLKSCY